jgi:hypothetical protein
MSKLFRWSRRIFQQPSSPVRRFKDSGFLSLNPTENIEEERLPWYTPDRFLCRPDRRNLPVKVPSAG